MYLKLAQDVRVTGAIKPRLAVYMQPSLLINLIALILQAVELGWIYKILKIAKKELQVETDGLELQKNYWQIYFKEKTEWYERRAKIKATKKETDSTLLQKEQIENKKEE